MNPSSPETKTLKQPGYYEFLDQVIQALGSEYKPNVSHVRVRNADDPKNRYYEVGLILSDKSENATQFRARLKRVDMFEKPIGVAINHDGPHPIIVIEGLRLSQKEWEQLKLNANVPEHIKE